MGWIVLFGRLPSQASGCFCSRVSMVLACVNPFRFVGDGEESPVSSNYSALQDKTSVGELFTMDVCASTTLTDTDRSRSSLTTSQRAFLCGSRGKGVIPREAGVVSSRSVRFRQALSTLGQARHGRLGIGEKCRGTGSRSLGLPVRPTGRFSRKDPKNNARAG